jgi:hypothetical protein
MSAIIVVSCAPHREALRSPLFIHEVPSVVAVSNSLIGLLANTCIETTGRIAMELGYHVTLVKDATAAFSMDRMHAAHELNGPAPSAASPRYSRPCRPKSRADLPECWPRLGRSRQRRNPCDETSCGGSSRSTRSSMRRTFAENASERPVSRQCGRSRLMYRLIWSQQFFQQMVCIGGRSADR